MEQTIFTEENISLLTEELNRIQPKNILVVTGSSSYKTSGADALIDRLFVKYNLIFFNDFSVNPKIEELENGIRFCSKTNIDFIIAIGGGSVIDTAKLIRCYMNCGSSVAELIKSNKIISDPKIPFLAIPTTAGSGSESTHFAVIYIDGTKYSVSHDSIRPDYALLYPSLTYNAPCYLTACSGADALSQAIESYWSVQSTEESREYAKEAIFLLWQYLPNAVKNDTEAKNKVITASNLAGRAINISFTTAAHAYSYALTSNLGIPHGHAVSLTLPYFFNLNLNVSTANCNDSRGVQFVKDIMNSLSGFIGGGSENASGMLSEFFLMIFGNTHNEAIAKITDAEKQKLTKNVNLQRLQNNPVRVTRQEIENIRYS